MTSVLFGSGPSGPREPPSREEREILVRVLAELEAALGNIDAAASAIDAPQEGFAGVRSELQRALELVRERIAM